ncbi:MAG: sulfurtransferase complex subunit TusC [Nitrospinae bacterium]|nr:sulfurtransferase complex subunit TusC [Nitrospinota bacterium]
MDNGGGENRKKIAFVMRHAPHGSIYSYEGLETVLIVAAYEQDLSLIFAGDGVFALVAAQDTSAVGIKGFIKTYRVLDGYDVNKIYVDRESMEKRGLKPEDFIIPVEVKEAEEIAAIMEEQHATIPY